MFTPSLPESSSPPTTAPGQQETSLYVPMRSRKPGVELVNGSFVVPEDVQGDKSGLVEVDRMRIREHTSDAEFYEAAPAISSGSSVPDQQEQDSLYAPVRSRKPGGESANSNSEAANSSFLFPANAQEGKSVEEEGMEVFTRMRTREHDHSATEVISGQSSSTPGHQQTVYLPTRSRKPRDGEDDKAISLMAPGVAQGDQSYSDVGEQTGLIGVGRMRIREHAADAEFSAFPSDTEKIMSQTNLLSSPPPDHEQTMILSTRSREPADEENNTSDGGVVFHEKPLQEGGDNMPLRKRVKLVPSVSPLIFPTTDMHATNEKKRTKEQGLSAPKSFAEPSVTYQALRKRRKSTHGEMKSLDIPHRISASQSQIERTSAVEDDDGSYAIPAAPRSHSGGISGVYSPTFYPTDSNREVIQERRRKRTRNHDSSFVNRPKKNEVQSDSTEPKIKEESEFPIFYPKSSNEEGVPERGRKRTRYHARSEIFLTAVVGDANHEQEPTMKTEASQSSERKKYRPLRKRDNV